MEEAPLGEACISVCRWGGVREFWISREGRMCILDRLIMWNGKRGIESYEL